MKAITTDTDAQSAKIAAHKTLAELEQMIDAPQGNLSAAQYARYQQIVATAIEIHTSRSR